MQGRIGIHSIWRVKHFRNGKLLSDTTQRNLVTNEGLDALLDIMFHGDSAIATWYIALVESNTSPAAGMTYAVPTYTESTAYDEATREAYDEAAASSQSMSNAASKAEFTMSDTKTIYGAALVSDSTKGDVAASPAYLFCYSLFAASKAVVDDDVLQITCTLNAADA